MRAWQLIEEKLDSCWKRRFWPPNNKVWKVNEQVCSNPGLDIDCVGNYVRQHVWRPCAHAKITSFRKSGHALCNCDLWRCWSPHIDSRHFKLDESFFTALSSPRSTRIPKINGSRLIYNQARAFSAKTLASQQVKTSSFSDLTCNIRPLSTLQAIIYRLREFLTTKLRIDRAAYDRKKLPSICIEDPWAEISHETPPIY